jgi:hypothetical protein
MAHRQLLGRHTLLGSIAFYVGNFFDPPGPG